MAVRTTIKELLLLPPHPATRKKSAYASSRNLGLFSLEMFLMMGFTADFLSAGLGYGAPNNDTGL